MGTAQQLFRHIWILGTVVALIGCAGEAFIPVTDLTSPRGRNAVRMVRPGDSLYMIAWEAGLDYRQLANWNQLVPPYRLTRGMRIRLSAPGGSESIADGATRPVVTALSSKASVTTTSLGATNDTLDSNLRVPNWLWPTKGAIIQRFTGKNGNNGIDIAGTKGALIIATADGVVVYAGSGLRGYGKLVIIQHNDVFLSAYAHNQALLVSEGAAVRAGQAVAELGDSDAQSPRLHFEIRRDGKPVNPLDYLPH